MPSSRLLLAFLAVWVVACASMNPNWPRATAVPWRLVEIEGEEPLPGSRLTLRLEAGQMFGEAGVNQFFGSYVQVGQRGFRGGRVGTTRMSGPPEFEEQERRYLVLLEASDELLASREDLRLRSEGRLVLRFVPDL